jgi:hypothetical protein
MMFRRAFIGKGEYIKLSICRMRFDRKALRSADMLDIPVIGELVDSG